jgi:hypothetical protein
VAEAMRDYVDVAERIAIFREKYPNGSLQPANLEKPFEIVTVGDKTFMVVVSAAYRTPDDPRPGIGMAWEPLPSASRMLVNSELMVCETSSWGRAIVATLAADTKRVASADEVRNRQGEDRQPVQEKKPTKAKSSEKPDAMKALVDLASQAGITDKTELRDYCSMTLERDIKSSAELTPADIAKVVVALKDLVATT